MREDGDTVPHRFVPPARSGRQALVGPTAPDRSHGSSCPPRARSASCRERTVRTHGHPAGESRGRPTGSAAGAGGPVSRGSAPGNRRPAKRFAIRFVRAIPCTRRDHRERITNTRSFCPDVMNEQVVPCAPIRASFGTPVEQCRHHAASTRSFSRLPGRAPPPPPRAAAPVPEARMFAAAFRSA